MLFIIIIIFLIILLFSKDFYKTPEKIGLIGEKRVSQELSKLPSQYKVINNILLQLECFSTQIDHIVISIYGIFIIETKNYSGWIFGNEKYNYWTQVLYKKKTQFKNPIKQNIGHIFSIKKVLRDYKNITFFSIIVFAGNNCEIKKIANKTPVIYDHEIVPQIYKAQIECLSIKQVEEIYKKLSSLNINTPENLQKHIQSIKNKY